jgi:hypothetical protein
VISFRRRYSQGRAAAEWVARPPRRVEIGGVFCSWPGSRLWGTYSELAMEPLPTRLTGSAAVRNREHRTSEPPVIDQTAESQWISSRPVLALPATHRAQPIPGAIRVDRVRKPPVTGPIAESQGISSEPVWEHPTSDRARMTAGVIHVDLGTEPLRVAQTPET